MLAVLSILFSYLRQPTTTLKKLTAILFLIITCVGYTGYHLICVYQIQYAKEEAALKILRQIPDSQLTKIEEDKVLKWNGDDELWYNNQMFDVVKKVSQNGREYLLCIADADEAVALKKLADLVQTGSPSGSNGKDVVKIKNSLPDIFCKNYDFMSENVTVSASTALFYEYSSPLSRLSRNILLRPPKF
jgi:hypothetical protein